MCRNKFLYFSSFLLIIYFSLIEVGCKKEYSYEGGPLPDSLPIADTVMVKDSSQINLLPVCNGCTNLNISASVWSFKIGAITLCGDVTRGVLSPDKDAFTFFGPSLCSIDTGLIITAFFPTQIFNKDLTNITSQRAALEYYDNKTMTDILQSNKSYIFTVIVNNFNNQTKIANGVFTGWVIHKNGTIIKIDDGKFNVVF